MKQIKRLGNSGSPSSTEMLERTPNNKVKDLWLNFKQIPNVSTFKINLSGLDPRMLKYGIYRREFKPELVITKHRLGNCNKFIKHQLIRLRSSGPIKF